MHRTLTVGLDATRLNPHRTGIENYTYNLLSCLPDALSATADLRVIAFVPRGLPAEQVSSVARCDRVALVEVGAAHPIVREQLQLPLSIFGRRLRLDLFHSTGFPAPVWAGTRKRVVTVHDVVYRTHPETMSLGRFYWRALMPMVLAQASSVLVNSQFTADELLEQYPFVRRKVTRVVPLGVSGEWLSFRPEPGAARAVADRYGLPDAYIAWVGALRPRKNLPFLVDVLASVRRLHPRWSDLGLVLAGANEWKADAISARIRERGLENAVHFPGYVPDEDLRHIIAGARAFAFPSRHEGFGLPPLEAMACGTPVLVSAVASLPDVVGDAGIALPLDDERAWVDGLVRVLESPSLAEELGQLGRARAATFTWRACAAQTVDAYRATLGLA